MKTMILCLFCFFITGCTNKPKQEGTPFPKEQENKTDNIRLQKEPYALHQPADSINPDSLSMQTEYDYYPLSTTEVKVSITNRSHNEYNCEESYALAFYNEKLKSWESLPTNPIIDSIHGYSRRNILPTHRQSNFTPPKYPIVRVNIASTRHSTDIRELLMQNSN